MIEQEMIDYAKFLYYSNNNNLSKHECVNIALNKNINIVRDICNLFDITKDEYINNLIKEI